MAIGRACRDAGVPHGRRMTSGTGGSSLLHHQGESWAEIGAKVGQRNLSVTADTYTHALFDYREIDRPKLLDRARMTHPPLHTRYARNDAFAETF